jgi:hypothetical protein
MRQIRNRWSALALAVAAVCFLGYAGSHLVAPAGAVPTAGVTDTEPAPPPAPEPQPSPDPAPVPRPKAPPAAKPAAKPVPSPAPSGVVQTAPRTYTSPVQTTAQTTPVPAPRRVHPATHVRRTALRRHRHRRPEPAPVAVPAQPTLHLTLQPRPASVVHVLSAGASASPRSRGRNGLVIAGLVLAALLFLTAAATPAQATRFGLTERVVLYHKTELLLGGVGTLLLTAIALLITGGT